MTQAGLQISIHDIWKVLDLLHQGCLPVILRSHTDVLYSLVHCERNLEVLPDN